MEKGKKNHLAGAKTTNGAPPPAETSRVRGSSKGPRIGTMLLSSSVDAPPVPLMYLDQDVLAEGLKHSTQLMQQHREEGHARRQRHEQRRRKFLRQLDTSQMNFSNKVFEQEVIGQVLNFARCEQEEKEFKDEVLSYKDIMVNNRNNRDKKIQDLKEKDQTHDTVWETIETHREIEWVMKSDTESQLHRRETLLTATRSANRDEAISMVNDFISKMLDQVDWTLTCREIGGFGGGSDEKSGDEAVQPLPQLLWKDASTMLTADLPFLEPLPNLTPLLPSSVLLPFSISEAPHLADKDWLLENSFKGTTILDRKIPSAAMTSSDFLAKEDWLSYLENLNGITSTKYLQNHRVVPPPAVEGKHYSTDELLTPAWLKTTEAPNFLGEAVVEIRCRVEPIPPEPLTVVDTSAFPLRAVLFGVSDRMRELTVLSAKNIPRINVVSVETLVKNVFSYYEKPDKDLESEYGKIAQEVFYSLGCGAGITDKLYVKLIIHELKVLSANKSNGFLISDYPNSKEQLLLLMEGFSNIRYDEHKPQRADNASLLAPLPPNTPDLLFDVSKCGLDVVLCVDALNQSNSEDQNDVSSIDKPLRERVQARRNLITQEIVYISNETSSVANLQKIYDPKRPMMTCGLDLTIAEQNTHNILSFAERLGIANAIEFSSFDSPEEAINMKMAALVEKYIPENQRVEQFWIDWDLAEAERIRLQKEEEEKTAAALLDAELTATQTALEDSHIEEPTSSPIVNTTTTTADVARPAEDIETAPAAVTFPAMTFDKVPAVVEDNILPIRLAEALSTLWGKNEVFSYNNGHNFFTSMRNIRYQFVQRRRIALDTIYTGMIRVDDRQEKFNNFREEFNAIDNEMRFDPDCIAELHLRTTTLRNQWSQASEQRLKELKDVIQKITLDGNTLLFQYNGRYESSYFLQSELNRFYCGLQIIFDYAKSIQGFQCFEKIRNELEVLLPITAYDEIETDAGGKGKDKGKEKEKKGGGGGAKGATGFQPYREPLAPYFMVNTQMIIAQVPLGKNAVEEVIDPKAKGKSNKDKKGSDEGASVDFFAATEALICEEINKWKEGSFTIPRELHYNRDEALCKAIESAVWYEAEKLLQACEIVRTELSVQNLWLERSEQNLLSLLQSIAEDRFVRELRAGENLVLLIEGCIMNAQPLEELWIVSADATPLVDPITAWDRLNSYLAPEVKEALQREREEDLKRRKLEERLRREEEEMELQEQLVGGVLAAQRAVIDRTEKMSSESRPATGGKAHSNNDQPFVVDGKVGRNPARERRDDEGKIRSTLQKSFSAGRSGKQSGRPKQSPDAAQQSIENKNREIYLKQKIDLEEKFHKRRAAREEEYLQMGMSNSAAVLAAHHELFLEEQHEMEDFEAKFRAKRPNSSARNSGKRKEKK